MCLCVWAWNAIHTQQNKSKLNCHMFRNRQQHWTSVCGPVSTVPMSKCPTVHFLSCLPSTDCWLICQCAKICWNTPRVMIKYVECGSGSMGKKKSATTAVRGMSVAMVMKAATATVWPTRFIWWGRRNWWDRHGGAGQSGEKSADNFLLIIKNKCENVSGAAQNK